MPTTTNFGWTTPADTDLVKDGALAIRTLANGIDTSFLDLKGGTTGQILSKNSNTDLDFTWIANDTGDITSVTAGTGISGGGTSGAVTITNSMATEITAAGDIIIGTGSGTFDNLPIGTTGQILTADTTVSPYKVKWATASSSTPAFVGVSLYRSSDQTLSNNTSTNITFDSELFDTDSFHSTSSNTDRITIPTGKGGYYLITSVLSYAQNSTGVRSLYIRINGTTVASGIDRNADGNNRTTILMSVVRNLSVGDYLTTDGYQTSGGNLAISSNSYLTYFSAQFLGA